MRLMAYCGLMLACMAGRSVFAQQAAVAEKVPAESEIEGLIQSAEPREMAWGAHYAYLRESPKLDEELLAAAERWQPLVNSSGEETGRTAITPEQMDKRDGMAAVLDALIRLHVTVQAEILRGLAADFPNEVAVLLSRLSEDEFRDVAMEYFRKPPKDAYGLQYVSAALLAKSPPERFAGELLASVTVKADVFIQRPGEPSIGIGRSSGCCGGGIGSNERKDWPAFGSYHLTKAKSPRTFLLLSAPDPIYGVRSESTHYAHFVCGDLSLTDEDRRRMLAYMLKVHIEDMGWEGSFSRTIFYRSPQQVNFELQSLIDEEQEKYRVTARQLVQEGLMTESEVEGSLPMLILNRHDLVKEESAEAEPLSLSARVSLQTAMY